MYVVCVKRIGDCIVVALTVSLVGNMTHTVFFPKEVPKRDCLRMYPCTSLFNS